MKTATAKASWLEETGVRLDASYHLSEGRQAKIHVEQAPLGTELIADIAERVFYGSRAKRYYVDSPERGVPFMGSSDMLRADLGSIKYVSNKYTRDLNDGLLQRGWTLISRSGTIGNTAYTTADYEGKIASEHVIRVVPNGKILSGYLYAFLSSRYGYGLLTQGTFGAVIQHIEPDYVNSIPVPRLPAVLMQQIHVDIEQAARLREAATRLLEAAKQRIVGELKLGGLLSKPLTKHKAVRLSTIQDSYTTRLEANAFAGFSGALIQHFESHGIKCRPLSEVSQRIFRPGIFKRVYVKNGIPFLGGGEMMQINPKPIKQLSKGNTFALDTMMLEKHWTLITRSGTIGSIIFTDESHSRSAASEHIIRVVAGNDIQAGFLHAYLLSSVGKSFIKDYTYGSVIPQIEAHHIANIPVPTMAAEIQEVIHQQVIQASDMQFQANQLEDKAIHAVETAISAWQK